MPFWIFILLYIELFWALVGVTVCFVTLLGTSFIGFSIVLGTVLEAIKFFIPFPIERDVPVTTALFKRYISKSFFRL